MYLLNLLNNLVIGLGGGAPGKFCIIRPLRTHLRLSEIAKQIKIKAPKAPTWGLSFHSVLTANPAIPSLCGFPSPNPGHQTTKLSPQLTFQLHLSPHLTFPSLNTFQSPSPHLAFVLPASYGPSPHQAHQSSHPPLTFQAPTHPTFPSSCGFPSPKYKAEYMLQQK